MPETAPPAKRFQMSSARAALSDGPFAESLEQQLRAIENAIDSVPDFAFDLSKTLVESVCKTVLSDLGQPADSKWDCPRLVRETTNRLSLLPRNHPEPAKARDSLTRTVNGLLQTIQGLCELRNKFGMASHGKDGFSARLDLRQAVLAAQAADTIAAFIYRIHRDATAHAPGSRIYYEDHADFNDAFDSENDVVSVAGIDFLPSQVLFFGDREAYKAALLAFIAGDVEPDVTEEDAGK